MCFLIMNGDLMTTSAFIMMTITWTAILGMITYLFTKIIRKENQKKGQQNGPTEPKRTTKEDIL